MKQTQITLRIHFWDLTKQIGFEHLKAVRLPCKSNQSLNRYPRPFCFIQTAQNSVHSMYILHPIQSFFFFFYKNVIAMELKKELHIFQSTIFLYLFSLKCIIRIAHVLRTSRSYISVKQKVHKYETTKILSQFSWTQLCYPHLPSLC